jgi:cyclophilin family peptidyl-prolyl cis-trans isomerase
MAHAGRDTGGSQFFLTFAPTMHLNGMHTVFGRVIDGMDVLAKIQRRDPNDKEGPRPDMIVEARVIRKRPHEYKPQKMPE